MNYTEIAQALTTVLQPIDSEDIVRVLRNVAPYKPSHYYDHKAEKGLVPPMIVPFYLLVAMHNSVPRLTDFQNCFFAVYDEERYPMIHNGLKCGVLARLNRTYPSLVRDYHLWAIVHESGIHTTYDINKDRRGIDLTVKDPNTKQVRYVHAFIDSPRSRQFRKGKPKGHSHLDLPLKVAEARNVNGYLLYDQLHIDMIWASFQNNT